MIKSILTIDQATRSGFCLWNPGSKPVLSHLDLSYCNGDLGHIMSAFERHLRPILKGSHGPKVDFVRYEKPILIRTDTVVKLRRLYGFVAIIVKLCHNLNIPCDDVAISTWRKSFLGSGKISGKEAKSQCMIKCEQMGLEFEGDDECEAMGIMDGVANEKGINKDWPEPAGLRFTQ